MKIRPKLHRLIKAQRETVKRHPEFERMRGLTRRRTVIFGMAATALALAGGDAAKAIGQLSFRPGLGHAASSVQLATYKVANVSGTNTNFHTRICVAKFVRGAIPSGSWPKLQLTNGTPCPVTWFSKRTWADGSWKKASFLPIVPTTLTTTNMVDVELWTGGAEPASGTRTISEVEAEVFKTVAVGLDNLSGTYTALCEASALQVKELASGPTCNIFRVIAQAKTAGTPHAHLLTVFYVVALSDINGDLAGFRVLPAVTQPWYDVGSKATRTFTSLTFEYGAGPTVVNPMTRDYTAQTVTVPTTTLNGSITSGATTLVVNAFSNFPAVSGSSYIFITIDSEIMAVTDTGTANWTIVSRAQKSTSAAAHSNNATVHTNEIFRCVSHNYDDGMALRITAGTSLPTGIASGTHFIETLNTPTPTNFFRLMSRSFDGSFVYRSMTSPGVGTLTLTPYNYVQHFGTAYLPTNTGKYHYIQGAGTIAAEADVFFIDDAAYFKKTGLMPPLDLNASIAAPSNVNWKPASHAHVSSTYLGTTGLRSELAAFPGWAAAHIVAPTAITEQAVRMTALVYGHFPVHIRDSSTKGPLNIANTNLPAFTGFPSSLNASFHWDSDTSAGFTGPDTSMGACGPFSTIIADHFPNGIGAAILIDGSPHLDDAAVGFCNMSIYQVSPANRTKVVGATTYQVTSDSFAQFRTTGWNANLLVMGAGLTPDSHPDGDCKGYTKALMDEDFAHKVAWLNDQNTFAKTNGVWIPQDSSVGSNVWARSYVSAAFLLGATVGENADAQTMALKMCGWFAYVADNLGPSMNASYYEVITKSSDPDDPIDAPTKYGRTGGGFASVSWDSGTDVLTINSPSWTVANGDIIMPTGGLAGQFAGIDVPGGTSAYTPYQLANVSGNGGNLQPIGGGSNINITDTKSGVSVWGFGIQPADDSTWTWDIYDQIYGHMPRDIMQWGKAVREREGLSTSDYDAAISVMSAKIAGYSDGSLEPWTFTTSFNN